MEFPSAFSDKSNGDHVVVNRMDGYYFYLTVNGELLEFGPFETKKECIKVHDVSAWRAGYPIDILIRGYPPVHELRERFFRERKFNLIKNNTFTEENMGRDRDVFESRRIPGKTLKYYKDLDFDYGKNSSRFQGMSWYSIRQQWTCAFIKKNGPSEVRRYEYEEDCARAYSQIAHSRREYDRMNFYIPDTKTRYPPEKVLIMLQERQAKKRLRGCVEEEEKEWEEGEEEEEREKEEEEKEEKERYSPPPKKRQNIKIRFIIM